jgi:hypothetical protein
LLKPGVPVKFSPNGRKVLGDDIDGSGYNPAISILDLDSGNMIHYLRQVDDIWYWETLAINN